MTARLSERIKIYAFKNDQVSEDLNRLVLGCFSEEVAVLEARLEEAEAVSVKAKAIGSIEWVIIEAALKELGNNRRVRDEVIEKVQDLRRAVLHGEPEMNVELGCNHCAWGQATYKIEKCLSGGKKPEYCKHIQRGKTYDDKWGCYGDLHNSVLRGEAE